MTEVIRVEIKQSDPEARHLRCSFDLRLLAFRRCRDSGIPIDADAFFESDQLKPLRGELHRWWEDIAEKWVIEWREDKPT